jgi:hypothetical protein
MAASGEFHAPEGGIQHIPAGVYEIPPPGARTISPPARGRALGDINAERGDILYLLSSNGSTIPETEVPR